MGTGGVGVAAEMDQFVGVIPLEIGQQVHLPGCGKLFLGYIGHRVHL